MRVRTIFVTASVAGLLMLAIHPVQAQHSRGSSMDGNVFNLVKIGGWVQISGVPQKDMTVMATKVKVLTGDFMDDDWQVFGKVRGVVASKKQFKIATVKVRSVDDTDYESDFDGDFKGFTDIRSGMLVEAEGTFLKDGTFLAEEIQDETKNPKKAKSPNEIKFKGRVQNLDAEKKTITLMGVTFKLNDQTKLRSAVK